MNPHRNLLNHATGHGYHQPPLPRTSLAGNRHPAGLGSGGNAAQGRRATLRLRQARRRNSVDGHSLVQLVALAGNWKIHGKKWQLGAETMRAIEHDQDSGLIRLRYALLLLFSDEPARTWMVTWVPQFWVLNTLFGLGSDQKWALEAANNGYQQQNMWAN